MPAATKNQKVLVKAAHVWNQNNVVPVIKQYSKLLPNAKLLMIVRDPIYRYVSDIVQFNYGKALKANIKPGTSHPMKEDKHGSEEFNNAKYVTP